MTTERNHIFSLLDNDGVGVHFQPIVDSGRRVLAYEALARVGNLGPFHNIEAVFRSAIGHGVISQLDMYCREMAISTYARQRGCHEHVPLFINICPETLTDPVHLVGLTDGIIERAGMSKEHVVLELTEFSAISNWDLFKEAVSHYRSRGYRIAIDDFGAGYGGLRMLSEIMPDYVKVDKYFIRGNDDSAVRLSILESVVALCKTLGILVVAEGIETEEEFTTSRLCGVDLYQGYRFGKPEAYMRRTMMDAQARGAAHA